MDNLILEPFAVEQLWQIAEADGHWESLIGNYLKTIAEKSLVSKKGLVGHIKALALFSDDHFFRASVIAPHIPPSFEGDVPAGCQELLLTVNVLIYGVQSSLIDEITRDVAASIAEQWHGKIITKKTHHLSNTSKPHQHKEE